MMEQLILVDQDPGVIDQQKVEKTAVMKRDLIKDANPLSVL